jgi:hypothetical protein
MTMTSTPGNGNGSRFPSDRRERAKAMVEAGLFGGAGRGQGRKPKARTAGESVAELAAQETSAIKRAYSDGLRSKNERTRLYAAEKLLATERAERERRADEDWPSYDWEQLSSPEQEALFMLTVERAFERDPAATIAILRAAGLQPPVVIDSVAVESSA